MALQFVHKSFSGRFKLRSVLRSFPPSPEFEIKTCIAFSKSHGNGKGTLFPCKHTSFVLHASLPLCRPLSARQLRATLRLPPTRKSLHLS